MRAARSVPLGLTVATVVWLPSGSPIPLILAVAAPCQVADVIIGLSHRIPGMAVGAATAAACHIGGAFVLP